VQLVLVQQHAGCQQGAEQGAELAKTLQRLFEVAGIGQCQADIAVVPGQQALAKQKAAVCSAQQAFGVADERQQLLRADAGAAAGDVLVEQPTAAQQCMAVNAARERQVQQYCRLVVCGYEARVPFVPM